MKNFNLISGCCVLTSCHVNRQGVNRSTVLSEAVLLVWKYIFTLRQAQLFFKL